VRALHLLLAVMLSLAPALAQVANAPKKSSPAKRPTTAPSKPSPPALMSDQEKTIYAVGLSISQSLSPLDLSPEEIQIITRALTDAAAGKPEIKLDEWGPKIEPLRQERSARALEKQKAASNAYLEKAASEPGASKTESGLVYREITSGTGASPKATDTVKVNYRGTLIDGIEFDSSYRRNQPATFPLNGVIPCWTEGMQKMKVGGKSVLVCPSSLAYGDQGRPSIPGGAALIFEIELLDITPGAQ
jgi:FKBP-type peptidyl-prolyl cis-trans isomerase